MKPTTAQSKFGIVEFKYLDDVKENMNPGWRLDVVEAHVNRKKVGYLKISYVPRRQFKEVYPDTLHYMYILSGWGHKQNFSDIKGLTKSLSFRLNHVEIKEQGQTDEWWAEKYHSLVAQLEKYYKKQYVEFLNYWVDKPLVDYISVDKEFQNGGIGAGLYIAGAKWMAEKDMVLFGSSLQSPEAKKSWEYLKKMKIPIHKYKNKAKTERVFIDYR
jgi:hypothetical protein